MKFAKLIFMASLLLDPVSKKSPTLNYCGNDVSYKEIFAEIKLQTDVVFFYDVELMKELKFVSIDLTDVSLEMALNEIFLNQPLTWTMEGRTVTIYKK